MSSFFKTVFGSCLGFILAVFVLGGVGTCTLQSFVSNASKKDKVKANSVLHIKLNKEIPEFTGNTESSTMDILDFETTEAQGLTSILYALEQAKTDDNIKGIFLDLDDMRGAGFATMSRLRKGLNDFKTSGKFVISYANTYSKGSYYMASVADEIYMNPMGGMSFLGFYVQIDYLKGLLDKIGVKPQIFYAGNFKSATEPLRRTNMSEPNRLQVHEYVGGAYDLYLEDIAKDRKISVSELKKLADMYAIREPQDAVNAKLITATSYRDEVLATLRKKLGIKEKDKIQSADFNDYVADQASKKSFKEKDKIAVLYAEGNIVDGEGDKGNIGGEKYAKILRKLREKGEIKALVLRVNSGGGSALASEIMWRELELLKADGVTVITSMGDVAASGGYYIACNSDKIFAEPNTITGSIGVFGVIPNTRALMEQKLGITADTIRTGKYAIMGSTYYELSEEEGKIIQNSIDTIYHKFKSRVAKGRNMSIEAVDSIAQGRVWLGNKARKIGLVDELGGLNDAIKFAAEKEKLTAYRIVEYPEVKDKWTELLDKISGKEQAKMAIREELGDMYLYLKKIKEISQLSGAQMRMPIEINLLNK